MPIQKTCQVCGKEFVVPPARAETAKTCSNNCAKVVRGVSSRRRLTANCKHCGKLFEFPRCHKSRRVYCSDECKNLSGKCIPEPGFGPDNSNWRGGCTKRSDGYIYESAPNHPFLSRGIEYVLQHRLRMEEWMRAEAPGHPFLLEVNGVKYLRPEIEVHHVDRDRANNSRSNLLACTKTAHRRIHANTKLKPEPGTVWPWDSSSKYG